MGLISEKNISQISKEAKKYYFKKNYRYVIELLYQRDLDVLSEQNRSDLEYLLADAFNHTGEYKKALEQVLSLLKQNKSDRLYLLLSMIYESLGENNIITVTDKRTKRCRNHYFERSNSMRQNTVIR